ncbi:C39 family peptidase [Peptoniphilus sp. SGI.035]|uniref:C39 family peptidase n=1 Tax=Peptoniphilus sp. SGI.035 TaxID=3420564 RepID=UPI003D087E3C
MKNHKAFLMQSGYIKIGGKNGKNRIANLKEYIEKNYPKAALLELREIEMQNFLQRDFEERSNNCTITSLTRIIKYYFKDLDKFEIYAEIFEIAKKNGYFKNIGTLPFFISHIANTYFRKNKMKLKSRGIYIGNFYSHVKNQIDNLNPVLMNLGSGYYKRHSLVIFGYSIYKFKKIKIKILHVYDGWHKTPSYIDYSDLKGLKNFPIFSYNIFNIDLSS